MALNNEIECSGFYRFIIAYEIIEKQRKVTGLSPRIYGE